jgi:hypothetical protein
MRNNTQTSSTNPMGLDSDKINQAKSHLQNMVNNKIINFN